MIDAYQAAKEIEADTIANRRHLHQHPEVGLDLPHTCEFISEKLTEYGLFPQVCGKGVSACVGSGSKCILLRADTDAVAVQENSGLDFASKIDGVSHCCGHDMHAAMLLSAARLLKSHENELNGCVKFMFQPAEETFEGAKNMIEAGVLEAPHVNAAMGLHVTPYLPFNMKCGSFAYNSSETLMNSADTFKITVFGKGSHGGYPHNSIDPINVASHIVINLQSLIAREVEPSKSNVLTIGKFSAGSAGNVIPSKAVLEGSIRSNCVKSREKLRSRLQEVSLQTAEMFCAKAQVDFLSEVPPLICDNGVTEQMVNCIAALDAPSLKPVRNIHISASEDFALVAQQVPCAFFFLGAGVDGPHSKFISHHASVVFDEDVLAFGTAAYVACALEYLNN